MVDYWKAIKRPILDVRKSLKVFFLLSLIMFIPQVLEIVLRVINFMIDTEYISDFSEVAPLFGLLVLIYIPLALVSSWIVLGYTYRATRNIIKNDYTIPQLDNFKDLIKKGIRLWGVSVSYMLLLIIVFVLMVVITVVSYHYIHQSLAIVLGVLFLILFVPSALILAYMMNMILTYVIVSDSFKEGFNLKKIFKLSFTMEYFTTFLVSLAYGIVAGIVTLIIMIPLLLTIVGWVFWVSMASIAISITQYTMFMETYKEITSVKVSEGKRKRSNLRSKKTGGVN